MYHWKEETVCSLMSLVIAKSYGNFWGYLGSKVKYKHFDFLIIVVFSGLWSRCFCILNISKVSKRFDIQFTFNAVFDKWYPMMITTVSPRPRSLECKMLISKQTWPYLSSYTILFLKLLIKWMSKTFINVFILKLKKFR